MMGLLGTSFGISLYLLLFAHLTKDRDFSQEMKTGSYVVFGLIGVVYVFTRIIF